MTQSNRLLLGLNMMLIDIQPGRHVKRIIHYII